VFEQYIDEAAVEYHLNGEAHAMAKEFFSHGGLVGTREVAKAYLLEV
jgi:quinol monooxygenase YgiN